MFFLQLINTFIDELRWDETGTVKRDQVLALKLDNDEWGRVNTFLSCLTVRLSTVGKKTVPMF